MKEEILKLRAEGLSYQKIAALLNCSKSTVAYNCEEKHRKTAKTRVARNRRRAHPLSRKIESFRARRALKTKTEKFQCRVAQDDPRRLVGNPRCLMQEAKILFKADDVINKFGENPHCALTGRNIDWNDSSSYVLDHIVPVHKGGDNSLSNLQLLHPQVNAAKNSLTDEEFILLCKEVLEYAGFNISK